MFFGPKRLSPPLWVRIVKERNVRSLVSFGARETYVAGLRLIENFTKVIVKGCYIDIGQPATHEKPLK